ncbi:MAG: hypothetical protein NAG76_11750 [Candidatus Pristimantibacillus lignocellulolyticus]|uniref:Uncharacterized protein n=1 Tax=Candidatus Pristimantibacillus lignocellulolyticus TaxID=2994561 RepID=A0A9J6Z9A6_9BACL|nr:MAG: hypothetical protein NAG76_11750 [Candidatus Pristimantibacillus lignocellulolyticus]
MKELIVTCALLLTMVIIYLSVIQAQDGVKDQIDMSNSHLTNYVKGIDA